jgi:putative hydrolase of the HAD superfamily
MAKTTHLLFDFFGTLVDYSASWTEQGYPRSHALVRSWGSDIQYERFFAEWSAATARFDAQSDLDDSEFSMSQVAQAFLLTVLTHTPDVGDVEAFVETYTREWDTAVVYPADTRQVLELLARQFTLAVVTNVHNAPLVPSHIEAMGISQYKPVDHPDVAIASGLRSGSENALQTPAGCLSGHQQTVAQDDSD